MQVYYFTRTNRSKDVAEEIASHLSVKANMIKDEKKWDGVVNYIKGGALAAMKTTSVISCEAVNKEEKIVLVFPVWAGGFPPAVRTFVNENSKANIILVPTSLGSKIKEREGFSEIIDLVGRSISASEVIDKIKGLV